MLVTVDDTPPGRTEQARGTPSRPADFAELVPELERQPSDILIVKKSGGAFATTNLDTRLRALGVTQVVLTGVSTSNAVEFDRAPSLRAGIQRHLPPRRHHRREAGGL